MSKLIKEIMDALNAVNQNKTQPYDRQGEVKRIEGKIAWVKLEGSDRETPIQMTIACDVGDTVQARIGGGSAWLTGNLTAPPTDDKKANEAIAMVTNVVQEVQEQVEEALEESTDVEDVTMQYCLSDSSSTFVQYGDWSDTPPEYVSGKYYWVRSVLVDDDGNETYGEPRYSQETQLSVETSRAYATTNAHFWYDDTGAYVTDSTQDDYKSSATGKYATRVTPTGILQSYGGTTLSSWTNSGISFLQGGSTVASFGSGGVSLYTSGAQIASFGSTIKLGSPSGRNWEFNGANLYFYQGSTLCGEISSIYGASDGGIVVSSKNSTGYLSVTDSVSSIDGNTVSIYALGQLQLQSNSLIYVEGNTKFYGHISPDIPDSEEWNCGTSSSPWNNVYASKYFASTTAPSSLSQDYAVAWHKTNSNNYVLCRPSSSRKWKKDIEPISDAIADPKKLYDVRVVQFRYKDKNADDPNNTKYNPTALDVGFIAEEVAEAYPLGAVINENGEPDDWNARRIIPPMLSLIQEQNKRITKLEERLS